jgi:Phage portal protein, SPP1 Gp6-like
VAVTDSVLEDVERYEHALDERAPRIDEFHAYYRGEARLAYATEKFREAFGFLLHDLADNWCQIVVDSSVERLAVQGFRFGEDTDADEQAWGFWQANDLDVESDIAHSEASQAGICYVLVTPDGDVPRISVVSGLEAIVETAPGDRRERIGGFKRWRQLGSETLWSGVLYTPDAYLLLEAEADDGQPRQWEVVESIANTLGEVPLIPMVNNPQIDGAGMSDLHVMLRLQDAINKLLADMLVNSEFVAYPQRWATGIEIPKGPDGKPLDREQFLSSVSRLWVSEMDDAKFGELGAHEGLGYVKQIEMIVQHIAAQTRTPPHYLTAGLGQYPSGDSLRASESGLVSKVKRKHRWYGEPWEESIRLSFLAVGETEKAAIRDAETIWTDPERRTEAQLVDALLKMSTLGVPREALWARYGASPQEIERWSQLADEAAAAAPTAPEVTSGLSIPSAPTD